MSFSRLTYLALLVPLLCLGQRTGKDSIALESGILRFGPSLFSTVELNALMRPGPTTRAMAYNDDTKSLWGWDGTAWQEFAGIAEFIAFTQDQNIINGSTNVVENNAVYDRFEVAVDESADSQDFNIKIWFGTKADYANRSPEAGTKRIEVIVDSTYVPPPGATDSFVTDVNESNGVVTFTGQGDAHSGSVTLDLVDILGGTDDQAVTVFQTFGTSVGSGLQNPGLILNLEHPDNSFNGGTIDLSKYVEDAEGVQFNDAAQGFGTNTVQGAIDALFAEGSYSESFTLTPVTGFEGPSGTGTAQVTYQRMGNIVYYNANLAFTNPYKIVTTIEKWTTSLSLPPFAPIANSPLKGNFLTSFSWENRSGFIGHVSAEATPTEIAITGSAVLYRDLDEVFARGFSGGLNISGFYFLN